MTTVDAGTYDRLQHRVLEHIEQDRLDPAGELDRVRACVVQAVDGYQRAAHLGQGPALRDPADMAVRLLASVTEFGPLTELLSAPPPGFAPVVSPAQLPALNRR